MQDAGGSYPEVELFKKLYGEEKIKLRIYKAVHGPSKNSAQLLSEGPIIGAFNHRFTLRTIKVVSDGALGSRGAALLAPYADKPETSGFLTVKQGNFASMFSKRSGKECRSRLMHIGDYANRFTA